MSLTKFIEGDNKRNLLYFEAPDMKSLYMKMDKWQTSEKKRLLSTDIVVEGEHVCCIALTNPTEVVICDGLEWNQARVIGGSLV